MSIESEYNKDTDTLFFKFNISKPDIHLQIEGVDSLELAEFIEGIERICMKYDRL